jgi:hypothetical protein
MPPSYIRLSSAFHQIGAMNPAFHTELRGMNPNWFRAGELGEVEGWLAWDGSLRIQRNAGPDVAGAMGNAS